MWVTRVQSIGTICWTVSGGLLQDSPQVVPLLSPSTPSVTWQSSLHCLEEQEHPSDQMEINSCSLLPNANVRSVGPGWPGDTPESTQHATCSEWMCSSHVVFCSQWEWESRASRHGSVCDTMGAGSLMSWIWIKGREFEGFPTCAFISSSSATKTPWWRISLIGTVEFLWSERTFCFQFSYKM